MQSINFKNYSNKLLSYSALATAFLTTSSAEVFSQCGNTEPGSPLEIDIDGDGTVDVTFVQNTTFRLYSQTENSGGFGTIMQYPFTTGYASFFNFSMSISITIGSMNGVNTLNNFNPYTYTSYSAYVIYPNPTIVPAGSPIFQPGCPTGAVATADISYASLFVGTGFGEYSQRSNTRLYYGSAYAVPGAGNAIVGLSTPVNICAASLNNNNVSLGNNYTIRQSYYYYNFLVVSNFFYGITYDPAAMATCNGEQIGLYTLFGGTMSGDYSSVTGPYYSNNTNDNPNTNPAQYIGIQFEGDADGDGIFETHNGWVSISIDPNTSQITCNGSGYQQCSVEDATQSGESSFACITAGEATNTNANCTADEGNTVPTLGQWGLIIFTLLLMNFGALSLGAFEKPVSHFRRDNLGSTEK